MPIKEVLAAAEKYAAGANKPLYINYLLLDGVNDSSAAMAELIRLLRPLTLTTEL